MGRRTAAPRSSCSTARHAPAGGRAGAAAPGPRRAAGRRSRARRRGRVATAGRRRSWRRATPGTCRSACPATRPGRARRRPPAAVRPADGRQGRGPVAENEAALRRRAGRAGGRRRARAGGRAAGRVVAAAVAVRRPRRRAAAAGAATPPTPSRSCTSAASAAAARPCSSGARPGPRRPCVGEVVHLWERGLRDDELCGCGEPFSPSARSGSGRQDRLRRLGQGRRRARAGAEGRRSTAPGSPPAAPARPAPGHARPRLRRYGDLLARLYAAVPDGLRAQVVVDASKHASTRSCVRRTPGIDLKVLHVVRDSPAVAYAWTKQIAAAEAGRGELHGQLVPAAHDRPGPRRTSCCRPRRRSGTPHPAAVRGLSSATRGRARRRAGLLGASRGRPATLALRRRRPDHAGPATGGRQPDAVHQRQSRRVVEEWRGQSAPPPPHGHLGLTGRCAAYGYLRGGHRRRRDPEVDVVVPTRDRPELLRQTMTAILAQDYPGAVGCSSCSTSPSPTSPGPSAGCARLVVVTNNRKPGLAGGRNSGILAARGELVAFCDDDDVLAARQAAGRWRCSSPTRRRAVSLRHPHRLRDRTAVRAGLPHRVTQRDLLRDRLTELHPSTFLMRRRRWSTASGSSTRRSRALRRGLRVSAAGRPSGAGAPVPRWSWCAGTSSRTSPAAGTRSPRGCTWLLALPRVLPAAGEARVAGQVAFARAAQGAPRTAHALGEPDGPAPHPREPAPTSRWPWPPGPCRPTPCCAACTSVAAASDATRKGAGSADPAPFRLSPHASQNERHAFWLGPSSSRQSAPG